MSGAMSSNAETNARLLKMLTNAIVKERKQWRPPSYLGAEKCVESEVNASERDRATSSLLQLSRILCLTPETFTLSISILDRFLSTVKAQPKYLKCISVACFFLAAKLVEEDEVYPTASEILVAARCSCSVHDILRMERLILDKLQWQLRHITALDFLQMYHAIMLSWHPGQCARQSSQQLSQLTRHLLTIQCHHQVGIHEPAVLALALLSLDLSSRTNSWLAVTLMLQKLAQLDGADVISCREAVCRIIWRNKLVHALAEAPATTPTKKRKLEVRCGSQPEDDDWYAGIRWLYGDEVQVSVSCNAKVSFESIPLSSQVVVA